MQHSLEARNRAGTLIFYSNARWLHPLFELEAFMRCQHLAAEQILLKDKVIGRASALLLAYLGFAYAQAEVLSRRALEVMRHHGLHIEAEQTIERIGCSSEDFLSGTLDAKEAYAILYKRRLQHATEGAD